MFLKATWREPQVSQWPLRFSEWAPGSESRALSWAGPLTPVRPCPVTQSPGSCSSFTTRDKNTTELPFASTSLWSVTWPLIPWGFECLLGAGQRGEMDIGGHKECRPQFAFLKNGRAGGELGVLDQAFMKLHRPKDTSFWLGAHSED